LKLAKDAASRGEVPVGAVIVKDGAIIARGSNTREEGQDPLGHAEIAAIREASRVLGSWRLIDCELYVTLEPCPMCLSACQQARVKRVVYGARDEKGGALCLGFHVHEHPKLNHRFGVEYEPVEECGEVLREFFRSRR
jgi:tRNA(adenine34) deaminase